MSTLKTWGKPRPGRGIAPQNPAAGPAAPCQLQPREDKASAVLLVFGVGNSVSWGTSARAHEAAPSHAPAPRVPPARRALKRALSQTAAH